MLERAIEARLVILGPPGAGKGTQAQRLASRLGVAHLSTGEILRQAVAGDTPLGRQARDIMARGDLLPDATIVSLIREALAALGPDAGFVLDGMPRTVGQAEALDRMLEEAGKPLTRVLSLEVPDEELVARAAARRICASCGATVSLATAPPRVPGQCDECAGKLGTREDDRPETVRRRLEVYRRQTAPVVDYYARSARLAAVSGLGSVEEVSSRIERTLKQ